MTRDQDDTVMGLVLILFVISAVIGWGWRGLAVVLGLLILQRLR